MCITVPHNFNRCLQHLKRKTRQTCTRELSEFCFCPLLLPFTFGDTGTALTTASICLFLPKNIIDCSLLIQNTLPKHQPLLSKEQIANWIIKVYLEQNLYKEKKVNNVYVSFEKKCKELNQIENKPRPCVVLPLVYWIQTFLMCIFFCMFIFLISNFF